MSKIQDRPDSDIWDCFEREEVGTKQFLHLCDFTCVKCGKVIKRNMVYGSFDELTLSALRDHIIVHIYERV